MNGPAPDVWEGVRPADESLDRVVLVMAAGPDRDLLADWLRASPRYAVATCDPERTPEAGYDLYLLDRGGLDRQAEAVRRHRREAAPAFLPVVLLATDPGAVASVVDDVVERPVDRRTLDRRIETLLRARRTSRRLSERDDQYRRLVELAPDAVLLVRDGQIVYANDAAVETFEVDRSGDLAGRDLASFAPADDGALDSVLGAVAEAGHSEFRDVTLRSAAGRTVDARVAGVAVTEDGDPAVQLLVRDVTEERRRDQRLTLFGRAIEAAVQGVTIADARQDDNPLIYANAAFERITGYEADEVLGRNCRLLQGEETDERRVAEIREALAAERPVATELLNYRKDGTPFWNRLEIVPIADEGGEVTHFLGLQRDITDRREREERLAVMDRVLRHNIRNRVNVIRGYTDELEDTAGTARIRAAAEDLLRISDQVRQYQCLVAERRQARSEQDLAAMVERIVEGVGATHPAVTVRFHGDDPVYASVHRGLAGAVEELFELAVVPDPAAADLAVTVARDDDEAVIELVDHGGTIPAADLEAILEERETPLDHANGLELWLVRWAVLYSDGKLAVERDGPTRVVLRFPLAE